MKNLQRPSRKSPPRQTRLVSRRVERLEADGETHRRDCECARCDAGFVPSEGERRIGQRSARRRDELGRARAVALRARERRRERERLRQLDLQSFFARSNAATDAEIARLRALRARSLEDRRLDLLLGLRNAGLSLAAAIAEVDRANLTDGSQADNDNAVASVAAASPAPGPLAAEPPAPAQPRDPHRSHEPPPASRPHESLKLFS
jgi:membrane protein involved in colicin uptake